MDGTGIRKGEAVGRKSWADLSPLSKVAVVILGTVQVGLLAAALWNIARRSADEVRGDRRMWAGLVFINWIGPLAYFTIGRKQGLAGLESSVSRIAERTRTWCPCCGGESTEA